MITEEEKKQLAEMIELLPTDEAKLEEILAKTLKDINGARGRTSD